MPDRIEQRGEPDLLIRAPWTGGGTRVLITCRDGRVGFDAQPFSLGELSKNEGLMLLVGYLDRVEIDRSQCEKRG